METFALIILYFIPMRSAISKAFADLNTYISLSNLILEFGFLIQLSNIVGICYVLINQEFKNYIYGWNRNTKFDNVYTLVTLNVV